MLSLLVAIQPHAHLEGTLLPRGFFLAVGAIYLAALAVDRLAERLRLPAAAAILLLGLAIGHGLEGIHHIRAVHVETLHRISLALLIFYAGLGTNLRRIRGMVGAGLRLGTLGVFFTLLLTALALKLAGPALAGGLPLAAALLAASCLTATDSGALDDLLASLRHSVSPRLTHLLQFETALSTVMALLCFGFISSLFLGHAHSSHAALHVEAAHTMGLQLALVGRHILAGLAAGGLVGALAPRLIDRLVRSEHHLLVAAVALAFVAYGLGQLIGGGGLLAVFSAGVCLSNSHDRLTRFDLHALQRGMHPFNTAAEFTVLLLLGFLVQPAMLLRVLPIGLLLAIVVPLARLAAVWTLLPAGSLAQRDRVIVAGGGLRGAVSLALAVAMAEELPHLRGIPATTAEPLAAQLLALVFVVVLVGLLLQTLGMQRVLRPQLP